MSTPNSETADSIGEKVQQHLDKLVGLRFVFRVRNNDHESTNVSDMKETLQEFSTLPSTDPEHPEPWFCWKVFRPKNSIEWELEQFRVYDGKNTYSFDKIDPLAPIHFSRSGWIKRSEGCVEASNGYGFNYDIPDFVFTNVLAGYGRTTVDTHINKAFSSSWQIVDSPAPDEYVLERQMKLPTWEKGYCIRAHVAMKPEPIVMRLCNPPDEPSDSIDNYTEVLELASFDGVVYPSKGRQFESNYTRCKFGRVFKHARMYEYEVESVERVPEQRRKTWVPDFPPGTNVSGSESRYIAHSREVRLLHFLNHIAYQKKEFWRLQLLAVPLGVGIKIALPFFRFAAKHYYVKNGWIIKHHKPTKEH